MTLDDLIDHFGKPDGLGPRAMPRGWMDNYAPRGVWFHRGWATHALPDGAASGGYNAELRNIIADNGDFYRTKAFSPVGQGFVVPYSDLQKVHQELFGRNYTKLELEDFDAGGEYRDGNAFFLQAMLFAPRWETDDYVAHEYPEVSALVERAHEPAPQPMAVYANVGITNNMDFFVNDLRYGFEFAQEARKPSLFKPFIRAKAPDRALIYDRGFTDLDKDRPRPAQGTFVHGALDVMRREVVTLLLANLRALARRYGGDMHFLIGGEFGTALFGEAKPGIRYPPECRPVTAANCGECQPVGTYHADAIDAFVAYLRRLVLPEDEPASLARRWQVSDIADWDDVDPIDAHSCDKGVWRATRDYAAFHRYMTNELGIAQYREVKRVAPHGEHGILSFEAQALELSWLASDTAMSGEWGGADTGGYYGRNGRVLSSLASIGLASGKPIALPLTSPPGDDEGCGAPRARSIHRRWTTAGSRAATRRSATGRGV